MKKHILFKFVIICIFISNPLMASAQESLCDGKIIGDLIKARTAEYAEKKEDLNRMLHGEFSGVFDPAKYFSFDIDNENAVKENIEKMKNGESLLFEQQFSQCADAAAEFKSLFGQMNSLYNDLAKLKIHFLSLSRDQRKILINFTREISNTGSVIDQLRMEQQNALNDQYDALESIKALTSLSAAETGENDKTVLNACIALEKTRLNLSFAVIEISQNFEKRYTQFREYGDSLNNYLLFLGSPGKEKDFIGNYKLVNSLWREVVDLGIRSGDDKLSLNRENIRIPDRIATGQNIIKPGLNEKYSDLYVRVSRLYSGFAASLNEKQLDYMRSHYKLIKEAGRVRSKYISELNGMETPAGGPIEFDSDFFSDIAREIKIVPYRLLIFFVSRWADVRQGLSSGFTGFLNLAKSLVVIIIILFSPFLLYFIIKKILRKIENLRRNLIYSKKMSGLKIKFSRILQHVNPYLPYFIIYFFIMLIDLLVSRSYVSEIAELFSYFKIIIIYRLLMTLFERSLKRIIIRSSLYSVTRYDAKIRKTGKFIGLFFLVVFVMLYAVESSAGEGYVYLIVSDIFYYLTVIVLLATAL